MKCENCNSTELELTKEGYVCKKCGHLQKPKRKQYTFPLDGEIGSYAKKR